MSGGTGERILVIRFSSLGDVVLAAPVFDALRRADHEVEITFLTRPEYSGLHAGHPDVDRVWAFDPAGGGLSDLISMVRAGAFDRVVDLHGSLRSRALCLRAGLPTRRLKKRTVRRILQTIRPPLKVRLEVEPVVDRYLAAAGVDDPDEEERVPVLYLSPEGIAEGRATAEGFRGGGEKRPRLVALLPGAKHPPKRWPVERFAALGRLIAAQGDRAVVLPPVEEPGLGEAVASLAGEGTVAAPVTADPMSLASLLAACDGAVANDSGPMHVAAAVGIPVVGLFGPTSPSLGFAPVGTRAADEHLGLFCSPCSLHGRSRCWRRERYCLEEMDHELVGATLYRLMG